MTTKYNVPWNGKCTECKAERAYIGLNSCECVNEFCKFYSQKQKDCVNAFEVALEYITEKESELEGATKKMSQNEWDEYDDFIYNINKPQPTTNAKQSVYPVPVPIDIFGTSFNMPGYPPSQQSTKPPPAPSGNDDND